MTDICNLTNKQCKPCEGGVPPLSAEEAGKLMQQLEGWSLANDKISKTFEFKNHYQTLAFVNAVAWISHRENHHPDMSVGYNKCHIEYMTHAINGLSENDFICAAKIDWLFRI